MINLDHPSSRQPLVSLRRRALPSAAGHEALDASMARNAATTAIRIGAVCSAPTWVTNAASTPWRMGRPRQGSGDGRVQASEGQSQWHDGNDLVDEGPGRSPMKSAGRRAH